MLLSRSSSNKYSAFLFCAFTFFFPIFGFSQSYQINGVVLSNSEVLPGAHVIWGKTISVTNADGKFHITTDVPVENLRVSFIGFEVFEKRLVLSELEPYQITVKLKQESIWGSDKVVVTATRTAKDIEAVAQPISVVSNKEMKQSGSLRLSDILLEQVGMTLVSELGTGIQIQGMGSEYALILVDGQPLIGRKNGNFDLTRITVGNIKQVEIVKGPSSALWGSEALGGVINIITEKPANQTETHINSRIGSYYTSDLGVQAYLNSENQSHQLFVNRNASLGYKLNENSVSQAVPEYQNYTITYRGLAHIGKNIELELRNRTYLEWQQNKSEIKNNDNLSSILDEKSNRHDFSLIPILRYHINGMNQLELIHNSTWYGSNIIESFQDDGTQFSQSPFNQSAHKTELQWDIIWNQKQHTTSGVGYKYEVLEADRYVDKPVFISTFAFTQHDWDITEQLNLTAGIRADYHNEYAGEISPKIGLMYKLTKNFHLKASLGNGFKAPDFQQLYLNFTNPTEGYSVFGASTIQEGMQQLEERGEISLMLMNPALFSEISAERSFAVNVGFDYNIDTIFRIKLNAYRNNVVNLIDTQPVAVKTNGQSVYSYFNIDKIHTQGFEIETNWNLWERFSILAGYAYLEALDDAVVNKIKLKKMFRRNPKTNLDERVPLSDYGGLFNRSRHSGTFRVFYNDPVNHWEASIRVILRGRYGYFDKNNNQILDQDNEYEKGYSLTNVSAGKNFFNRLKLQIGVDNVFNFIRPNQLSFLPGRIYYAQINLTI